MIEPLPAGRARLVGPYQLLGLLGAGGMGEVYLARSAGARDPLAGLVALKTVRPDLDLDDGFRIRFRREIDAAGAVRSPHTAALVGGDANGRLPWLATEYVPGPSLAEAVIRTGPLPEPAVREMGAALARALADMHAVRVLHRDLKPGNVLLGADGPKVIDFGIAQAFDATQLTRTGVVVGSPGYISPEHVNGSRALVPASDVFCLGAVLAFAATGRGPFDDSDMAAVIFRISQGDAELSRVPPQLRAVIEECLRSDAGARPTPRQLVEMLLGERAGGAVGGSFPWPEPIQGLLAAHAAGARAVAEATGPAAAAPPVPFHAPDHGGPALAPTPVVPASVSGVRQGNRGRWIALAAAAVVCAVLGTVLLPGLFEGEGGNGGTGGAGGAVHPTASASGAVRTEAGPAVVPGADAGRTGDFGTAAADVSTRPAGWKAWKAKIADGPVECVLAGTSLVCGGPRRITVLDAANGKQRWQTPQLKAGTGPAAVAAVIDTTVYAFEDGALVAHNLVDGAEQWREPLPDGAQVADSVQSGGVLYYATNPTSGAGSGRIVAHRLTGTHGRMWDKEWEDPATDAELAFADGRLVVAGDGATVLKGADGARLGGIGADELACRMPVLKGKQLLCSGSNGLTVVDVTAPQNRRTIAAGVDIAHRPALSRDGKVVVSGRTRVYAFGLADGRQYWATYDGGEGLQTMGSTFVAGDQALVVEGYGVSAVALSAAGQDADETGDLLTDWPGKPGAPLDPASVSLLARGDALFLGFGDGTVLSVYAP
ncbi:serine/threonine-protein kinase [Streptomyces sp. NPDC052052]|uniref:serine/threonine-protein kinase n=1 Tax=Streptomyces sp. NPDC052052 TaxID=3154756 RepID=UPI003418B258